MKKLLYGKPISKEIKEKLKRKINTLNNENITPCLATILVGDDESSNTYINMKARACEEAGITSKIFHLPIETSDQELHNTINVLNNDSQIDGILLQHPIPSHLDERKAFDMIDIKKDVDGVTSCGYGQMTFGMDSYQSCTPAAIIAMLDYYDIQIEGKHVVVVGRSPILGKPVSAMLLNRNATVTTCHSHTKNLNKIIQQGDIVVAALGKPKFIKGKWVKEGSVILDAGYNPSNIGDVDFESCAPMASAITPVPGGIGPVTIAMLLHNTVLSAEKRSLM